MVFSRPYRFSCKQSGEILFKAHQILVDSQAENTYLLQIFTKNLFGPIFIEMIQRVDDKGFGEGNFSTLFKSIELNQIERGTL